MISLKSYCYICRAIIQNSGENNNQNLMSQCIEWFKLYDTTTSISFVNVLKEI